MSTWGQASRNIYEFYESLALEKQAESIYISPRMFGLFSKSPKPDSTGKVDQVIRKLTGLRILNIENNRTEEMALYAQAQKLIGGDYYELMRYKDDSDLVQFFADEEDPNDSLKELIMISRSHEGFFLMILSGNLTLEEITSLTDSIEIDVKGFDKLRTIK